MRFEVTEEEQAIIDKWYAEVQERLVKTGKAKREFMSRSGDKVRAEYGAIGGGLTYNFLPTSIGVILTVTESISGEKLNVTQANGWKNFG